MRGWWIVLRKEIVENARDRRTLASALFYGPLLGPVLFAVMISFILGQHREESEKTLELVVEGREHAPNLMGFLERQGVRIVEATGDAEASVRDQRAAVVLRIEPGYAERWNAGRPAPVELIHDPTRRRTSRTTERIRALLSQYGQTVAVLRLQVRGIAPETIAPIAVIDRDLSTSQGRAGMVMSMLPYLLMLAAFVGSMYLAIDTTAGERERQSLEPLLITPVSRAAIMAGKLLATTFYASISVLICVTAFAVSLALIPAQAIGMELALPLRSALQIGVLVLPIALLAASSQTVVASFAKSFREAQTYLQFLVLLPAIPSLMLAISPMKLETWMYWLPLLGQSALIGEVVRGEVVALPLIFGCTATTVLLSLLLAEVAVRLYQRENLALG